MYTWQKASNKKGKNKLQQYCKKFMVVHQNIDIYIQLNLGFATTLYFTKIEILENLILCCFKFCKLFSGPLLSFFENVPFYNYAAGCT